jgi:protease-4
MLYSAIIRGIWFIDPHRIDSHRYLIDSLLRHEGVPAADEPSLSARQPLEARVLLAAGTGSVGAAGSASARGVSRDFSDAPEGSIALIPVQGTLLKYGTPCSYGTEELATMVRTAADSRRIAAIVLEVDSEGGSIDAIAPLTDAILHARALDVPVVAHCDLCASAAYYIASYCNEIICANDISSELGSIGVMAQFRDFAKYYDLAGITEHRVYSTLSGYKNRAFELALTGKYEELQAETLDPLARDFQARVKQNRAGKLDEQVPGILSGRMFFAADAVLHGLADGVGDIAHAMQRADSLSRQAVVERFLQD